MEIVIRFVKSKYFSLPSIAWILLICVAVYALVGSIICPRYVPIEYFGPLGSIVKFFSDRDILKSGCLTIAFFALCCHMLETMYCLHMCSEKEIERFTRVKWLISTMCFGGCSLYELSRYQPEKIHRESNKNDKRAIPTQLARHTVQERPAQ